MVEFGELVCPGDPRARTAGVTNIAGAVRQGLAVALPGAERPDDGMGRDREGLAREQLLTCDPRAPHLT
ncbi:hypothetical protein CBM2599_A60022 [Cupriavidus taiwanensis]|nr:hypothetical protein CBM2599_A60022 [Cupriavidus taiwanensis]SOY91391.1 hypothetical protein CBM2600_A70022 [Cupriavidus taiwanensis]